MSEVWWSCLLKSKAPYWLAVAVALWRCGSWVLPHQTSLWRDMRKAWIASITTVVATNHTLFQVQMTVLLKYGTIRYSFFIILLCHMLDMDFTVSYRTVKTWVIELCSAHNNLRLQYLSLNGSPRVLHKNEKKNLSRF